MPMRLMLASLISMGLTLACGGSGGGYSLGPAPAASKLTIRFGSDSFPGYSHVWVSLEKVEGSTDGSTWIALGSVQTTVDLMALQNGQSAVILQSAPVSAATFQQFRITWATQTYPSSGFPPAYVAFASGGTQVLSMPTTTVVNGLVTVPTNGSATALIMLSGQQAVQLRTSGYTFLATGSAYDEAASAKITGHLAAGSTSLTGVEVFAETVDGLGVATIQRRAFSDGSGNYILEGLAVGGLYSVAAQPGGSISAYPAAAASPVAATGASTYSANLAFSNPQSPGSLTLTISPASTATQGTWGELRQSLPIGSGNSQTLIVRSQTVVTGVTQDQAGIQGLAPGTYSVTTQRSTAGAAPVMETGTAFSVGAGGFATQTLTYP